MGSLHRFNLKLLKARLGVDSIIETGTGHGKSLLWAHQSGITHIASVEQDPATLEVARGNLKEVPQVRLSLGDTAGFLREQPQAGESPRLFFLDAHFAGGADYKGQAAYMESLKHPRSFPLLEEIAILKTKDLRRDCILIDDARLYVSGSFGSGACPEWARQWGQREALDAALAGLRETHDVHLLRQDHGYFLLLPKGQGGDFRDYVRVTPGDPPHNGEVMVSANVPGVTSISMQRRLADSRFATRYFKGFGLDVGGGSDTLAAFSEFFPLARGITPYDMPNGDAQLLANVEDDSFDFLYSSHCLEHLRDPAQALSNWIRVVKPGGYLTVQVPDEDLYEQGHWPSRYNSDHKLTFTIRKAKSWSPVSVNVLDLLSGFSGAVAIQSVSLLDQGFRQGLVKTGFDQTRTPLCESGIEFVLQKRA